MWKAIKESLQSTLPASEYALWIKPLGCRRQDEQVLELAGPDRYFCAWVQERYLHLIKAKLTESGTITISSQSLSIAAACAANPRVDAAYTDAGYESTTEPTA